MQIALILEGGGMRGAFTAGILDFFLDKDIVFKDVYAVSAGACLSCSYLARQKGRGLRVWTDYIRDPRYCSVLSLMTTGDLFGAKMNYDLIPNKYDPIDYEAFSKSDSRFYSVVTNVKTGKAEYIHVKDLKAQMQAVRASASLPLVSRMVKINGGRYLDGGIADSVPLARSIADGHIKNVVILTREKAYRKRPDSALLLLKLRYFRHPGLILAEQTRHLQYNASLDLTVQEEKSGRAFVFRPELPPDIGRVEKNPDKLRVLYADGYKLASRRYAELQKFIAESEK